MYMYLIVKHTLDKYINKNWMLQYIHSMKIRPTP